jgi:hypothetical protein
MTTMKLKVGDDARIKTKTDIYKRLVVTIDEISEEKGMGLCSWPGGEEWMFLDDLEIVNTAESRVN